MSGTDKDTTVAIIGAGVAGLACGWLLARGGKKVTIFEADSDPGGHACTVDVPIRGTSGATVPVDVGFQVYNTRTYPDLVSLFELLNVQQENSSMSFACSAETGKTLFEWGSDNLTTLFADRSNLVNPAMYKMLWDMRRFNRQVHAYVAHVEQHPQSPQASITLGEFLDDGGYTHDFITYYIIPMVSAVWSASLHDALSFPAITLFHFFVNHGLAQVFARPQWRTPAARSRSFVRKIVNDIQIYGGTVLTDARVERVVRDEDNVEVHAQGQDSPLKFDHVVFATHAPTTLQILESDADQSEKDILGNFRYSSNNIYIHTDARLMPRNRTVWSSWNFISRRRGGAGASGGTGGQSQEDLQTPSEHRPVCVTYWLNRLQNLKRYALDVQNVFVTLNPCIPIDDSKILRSLTMDHPQFSLDAVNAQKEIQNTLQGNRRTWYCGSYTRYGFHEDAVMSGLDVAERLTGFTVVRPWMAKLPLTMSNNNRIYEIPYSNARTPLVVFWAAMLVIHLVVQRLARGLSKMSAKLIDDDPAVIIGSGDGNLQRFGPRRAPRPASDENGEQPPTQAKSSAPARITIRSPRVFARVTDQLRRGCDLAPILAASFAAREVDAPTTNDLAQALSSLFVAQARNRVPIDGYRGRMRLAEKLLASVVGGFDPVSTPPTEGRLPELATAIAGVVYPAWWRFRGDDDPVQQAADSSTVDIPCGADKRAYKAIRRRLEILGDLSGSTIDGLKADPGHRATIVVATDERAEFVRRKARLTGVESQVTVVLLDVFLAGSSKCENPDDLPNVEVPGSTRGRFDLIMSPAALNVCGAPPFCTMERALTLVRSLIADDGVVELGFTAHADGARATAKGAALTDVMLCGDEAYRVCSDQHVLDAAAQCGLALVRLSQMDASTAAANVAETTARVHYMAAALLNENEIRAATAQLCLWEAALRCAHVARRVALLKPS